MARIRGAKCATAAASGSRENFHRSSKANGPAPDDPRALLKLIVHVDGGSRGNPGPAAAGAALSDREGRLLDEASRLIGTATNNVAEYRALLLGLERAKQLGASEVEIINDSELIAKQVSGHYKVKHSDMKPLYLEAMAALREFDAWSIRSVPRTENAHADALVNAALDEAPS